MNPDDAAGDYFSCSYARLISYLLNAQPLQCSQAARRQLVAVVTDPQLPVAVVTPTVHLHEQSRHSVLSALVSEGGREFSSDRLHLAVVHQRHRGGLPAGDAHRGLALQAARHLPGVRLVGCGARAHLATVVVAPCEDLEGHGFGKRQRLTFNMKIPSSSEKTAATAASTLISQWRVLILSLLLWF